MVHPSADDVHAKPSVNRPNMSLKKLNPIVHGPGLDGVSAELVDHIEWSRVLYGNCSKWLGSPIVSLGWVGQGVNSDVAAVCAISVIVGCANGYDGSIR